MSTRIENFEIVSELAKSATSTVYKANDLQSGQTIALKAIRLSAFGESAATLEQALLQECESIKVLASPNITSVFNATEIEGQFCAPMEYVQGNSIATMLARKEGFSIWDLLDIGRQLCSGFDHAAAHSIVHHSLEPSKIMCGWDGTVKILSFGASSVGNFIHHAEGLSSILHYMSPEQVRGEATDGRSNLFSLGAVFYEMVTERKAFDREDVESLRQCILESTPVAPISISPKVHPMLSDLIMKALAKDPAERYQNGRALLDDLEKCKETRPAVKKSEAPRGTVVSDKVKAAVQSKFVGATAAPPVATPAPAASRPSRPAAVSSAPQSGPAQSAAAIVPPSTKSPSVAKPASRQAVSKAAAAAAGIGVSGANLSSTAIPETDISNQFDPSSSNATSDPAEAPYASMSSAVADEPAVETFEPQGAGDGPKITVDPMMAEGGPAGSTGTSFSEISELPPLKEVYVPPPPPPAAEPLPTIAPAVTAYRGARKADDKPKVQPREVAKKAIKEIKGVPPKLILYALAGAAALILLIGIAVTIYIHSQSGDDAGASRPVASTVSQPASRDEAAQPSAPLPASTPAQAQPVEATDQDTTAAQPVEPSRPRGARKKAPAPVVVDGQLTVDSTPQGAQVELDGKSDPSWVTPLALTNLQPGQHSITVSKAGYSSDTRSVDVTSGGRATAVVRLAQLTATLVVKSQPPGANIYVDGHDVGTKTPAQVGVDKGQHVVLVRMSGYLDETMNAQFVLGQTFNFSPTLRPLGNVDSIKTVGNKVTRLFGGKGQPGQGTVSIHTQPKGAQVAVNQHMLEKSSPVDVMVDPGNYIIDITLSGYAPVHKVISVDKSGKAVVDEVLQPQ